MKTLSLTKTFGGFAIAASLAGCASGPQTALGDCMEGSKVTALGFLSVSNTTYNKSCALNQAANQLVKSDDEGEKLLAQTLRETADSHFKEQSDKVRQAAVPTQAQCEVIGVASNDDDKKKGTKTFILGNCKAVPTAKAPALNQ